MQNTGQRWASASSAASNFEVAVDAVISRIRDELGTLRPHILFAFISGAHKVNFPLLGRRLNQEFSGTFLIGCSGGGVIGGGEELDLDTGISLLAGFTPRVEWEPIYLRNGGEGEEYGSAARLEDTFGNDLNTARGLILLPEPYSFNLVPVLEGLNRFFPHVPLVGGVCGGGGQAGENALYFGDRFLDRGLCGVAIHGDIEVDTLVAQGCRPLGEPYFITSCRGNVLRELDGKSALRAMRELFQRLPQQDQERFRTGLLLGIGMDTESDVYEMGDFVMRNILGIDPKSENVGISAHLSEHQVVQFHVRDGRAASEDLRSMLEAYTASVGDSQVVGGLLFSCVGRGSGLFGVPNHDTAMFSEMIGNAPLGGFFGNGEIGPVRGQSYLHGFSSSFALFRELESASEHQPKWT